MGAPRSGLSGSQRRSARARRVPACRESRTRICRSPQLARGRAGGQVGHAGRHRRIQEGRRAGSPGTDAPIRTSARRSPERRLRRGGEGVQAGARAGAEQRRRASESRDGASGDGRSGRRARTSPQGGGGRSSQRVGPVRDRPDAGSERQRRAARSRRTSGRSRSIPRCARPITRLATR